MGNEELELMEQNNKYVSNKQYAEIVGWQNNSVKRTINGKVVEYDVVPVFRSGVVRARLVSEDGVEATAYGGDFDSIEYFNDSVRTKLNEGLGIKLKSD